jgi:molybdopterin converting factor small subunit
MRLQTDNNPEELQYASMISAVGRGTVSADTPLISYCGPTDQETGTTPLSFDIHHTTSTTESLQWSFPNGFNTENVHNNCILASRNTTVDQWNEIVQDMNQNQPRHLLSHDQMQDVDDPHGYLSRMIDDRVMNQYNDHQCPPHDLRLKVDDICILLRHVNKENGYTNNRRVRIISISRNKVRVRHLLTENPNDDEEIPRYRF